MIVAAHQPHYFPWLGYLDRMRQADLFVVLDHVQFERSGYQNRTQILVNGLTQWLTLPVVHRSQQERIIDKQIDNPPDPNRQYPGCKHYKTLRHAYRDAPFFSDYAPTLLKILESRSNSLVEINQRSLDFLREAFAIHTPLIRSSELDIRGARSEMILNLCRETGADTYLGGMGGSRDYLDQQLFIDAGIEIAWQDFRSPVYSQCGGGAFAPGLSAIDLLFNHGAYSREILASAVRQQRTPALA